MQNALRTETSNSAMWRLLVLFMIIERFKNRDPVPVYRRFRDRGRMAPEGLTYVSSWVTEDMDRCYQVMECSDRRISLRGCRPWRRSSRAACTGAGRRAKVWPRREAWRATAFSG